MATGDFDGDGVPDIVTAPERLKSPDLKIFSGLDGHLLRTIPAATTYGATFSKGVFVAVGDVNGDGLNDIVVSPQLGGANIKVLSRSTVNANFTVLRSFNPFIDSPKFLGGATVAVADINGDGKADVIVGSGSGMTTLVRVFSGSDNSLIKQIVDRKSFKGGTSVSVGDVDGDGQPEIITGSASGTVQQGAGSLVRVYYINPVTLNLANTMEFYAFAKTDIPNPNPNAAVRVAVQNHQLYIVQGQDGRSQYQVRSFGLNVARTNLSLIDSFFVANADNSNSPDHFFYGGGLFLA